MPAVAPKTPSESKVFLEAILEDREWHSIDELVDRLVQSDIQLPEYMGRNKSRKAERVAIGTLYGRTRFEVKYEMQNNRRRAVAIRKKPNMGRYARARFCAYCGKGPLKNDEAVRRAVEYEVIARESKGNNRAGSFPSVHVCLDCADVEIKEKGGKWLRRPGREGDETDTTT